MGMPGLALRPPRKAQPLPFLAKVCPRLATDSAVPSRSLDRKSPQCMSHCCASRVGGRGSPGNGPDLRVGATAGASAQILIVDVIGQAVGGKDQAVAGLGGEGPHRAFRQLGTAEELVQDVLPGAVTLLPEKSRRC